MSNLDEYKKLASSHTESELASILKVHPRTIRRYAQQTKIKPKITCYQKLTTGEKMEQFEKLFAGKLVAKNPTRQPNGKITCDIECLSCGHKWTTDIHHKITYQTGCPVCDKGNHGNKYSAEEATALLNQNYADQWTLIHYGNYSKKNSIIQCNLCGKELTVNLANMILTTSLRCTNCQTGSFGEYVIRNTLRFNNIPYTSEHIVAINGHKYRIDFLIDNRIALEYSGMQHFEQGCYYNEKINEGVKQKQQWAESNGFIFYEIKAKKRMKDIITALSEILQQPLQTPSAEYFASSDDSITTVLSYMKTHSARQTIKDLHVSIDKIQHYVQIAGYESISDWQSENKKTQS